MALKGKQTKQQIAKQADRNIVLLKATVDEQAAIIVRQGRLLVQESENLRSVENQLGHASYAVQALRDEREQLQMERQKLLHDNAKVAETNRVAAEGLRLEYNDLVNRAERIRMRIQGLGFTLPS
jgi:hypothetical protein